MSSVLLKLFLIKSSLETVLVVTGFENINFSSVIIGDSNANVQNSANVIVRPKPVKEILLLEFYIK